MREENVIKPTVSNSFSFKALLRRKVTIPFSLYFLLSLLFLIIPAVIFMLGYLRPAVGIPFAVLFAGLVFISVRDCNKDSGKRIIDSKALDLELTITAIIGLGLIALVVSFISGIGEYIFTLQDHSFRRAILRDLIDYDWPVVYNISTQANPKVVELLNMGSGECAFSYYFIYWMPAAVVGKLTGLAGANAFLLVWNSVGIWLTLVGLTKLVGRMSRIIPFVYVFFAGLDAIPNAINAIAPYDSWVWLEGYVPFLSYVANFTELGNVFNQAVPCFLIMTLLLLSQNTRSMGLTGGMLFAYSPWAVFGIIPLILVKLFDKNARKDGLKRTITNIFSLVNIAGAMAILFLFACFYMANSGAVDYRGFTWSFYDNKLMFIPAYLVFIAIEVLPFVLMLYKREKNNPLFIASILTLLVIPVYRVSEMNDFSMRGSMPALFVISVMLMRMLADECAKDDAKRTKKDWLKAAAVTIAMILMMFPAFTDMYLIIGSQLTGQPSNREDIGSFGNINKEQYAEVIEYQFYVEDYQDKFFFKYLAR